ncbi:MAG TPA: hypothetical protein VFS21_23670 [Roseiflexaceae bacterium]|nr:hypothetical protein [Roseiflexaceae bacterium]
MEIREIEDGRGVRLTYTLPEDTLTPQDEAHLALDITLPAFAGFCEFLSVDLRLDCCDKTDLFPLDGTPPLRQFWQLHQAVPPPLLALRPRWTDTLVSSAGLLTPAALLAWLEQPLAQVCPSPDTAALRWSELFFGAVSVRFPVDASDVPGDAVTIHRGNQTHRYPALRRYGAIWVAGPLWRMTPKTPLEVRLANRVGTLTLDITFYWSVWVDPGSPGRRLVDQTLDRLRAAGWVEALSLRE